MQQRALMILLLVMVLSYSVVRAQDQLVVFAAASLTDAFEALADAFEVDNPDAEILFNFSGSSMLAAQLGQGAPADIFASANPQQMQSAIDEDRIAGEPITFAENRLVVIVPIDNPAVIEALDDLANEGVDLILAAPEVPIRVYTDEVLAVLADDSAFGENYAEAVLENLVSEEPNVRQVVAKIALGEADAGIVYASDVTPDIAETVLVLPIPDEINVQAIYPIAITDDTRQSELAQRFIDFVLSEAGQKLLVEWGFVSILDELNVEATPEATECVACGD